MRSPNIVKALLAIVVLGQIVAGCSSEKAAGTPQSANLDKSIADSNQKAIEAESKAIAPAPSGTQ